MIRVTKDIVLEESEIEENFIRAGGPGGQNVNKVATAVQLRFAFAESPSLAGPVKRRLAELAGRRATRDGILVISAQRFRTRERNRADALARLLDLIRRAALPRKPRRPTRPTAAAKERRLLGKTMRGRVKRLRRVAAEEG